MQNKNHFQKKSPSKKSLKSVYKALQLAYQKIFIHTNSALGRAKFFQRFW